MVEKVARISYHRHKLEILRWHQYQWYEFTRTPLKATHTYLWALKSDELGGLVGHWAGRLGTRRARGGLGHLLILVLESLLTKVALGLRLETLHRLSPCRSPLPSSEILGGNSMDILFNRPCNEQSQNYHELPK